MVNTPETQSADQAVVDEADREFHKILGRSGDDPYQDVVDTAAELRGEGDTELAAALMERGQQERTEGKI